MSVHDIVAKLDHCRSTGSDSWIARCPSHDDSTPSLSIKDVGGGRTLIHCHAGCGALDILESLGMDIGALYPPTDRNYHAERKQRERTIDKLVVDIAMADMRAGKRIKPEDRQRAREALVRLDSGQKGPQTDPKQVERNSAVVGKRHSERLAIMRAAHDASQ